MKVIIVGGVAGGASAAARLRRLDEKAEIVMLEKGPFVSYANCGLPYYIGGEIKNKEQLIVTKEDLFQSRFAIDVRTMEEVIKINPDNKTVLIKQLKSESFYEETYDKLILSPGASPKLPANIDVSLEGVFTLRSVPDAYSIYNFIKKKHAKRAVIAGGGFIGIEMAENLLKRGVDVTIVELSNQIASVIDKEMASIVQEHLEENGVHVKLEVGVNKIVKENKQLYVTLSDGSIIETDFVLVSVGVTPDSKIAAEAGLDTGNNGAIIVDENFETSKVNIFAVGDAIEVKHLINNLPVSIPLAGPANKQGRIVAEVISSGFRKNAFYVQGSSILKAFDLTVASTGLNERQLKQAKIEYKKVYIHPFNHATYYPDASPVSMKLLFSPNGKILGASAVGLDGVDKRIDVVATVMRLNGTVYDLEDLELCYAPPFSSAKDPVNMAGYVAVNVLKGDTNLIYAETLQQLNKDEIQLIDVRSKEEYGMGTIQGAKNIPLDEIRSNLHKIDINKPVYLFCQVGLRGYVAERILKQLGYTAYNLSGGYKTYGYCIGSKVSPVENWSEKNRNIGFVQAAEI